MKSLIVLPLTCACALVSLSSAVAAEPSGRTELAAVDPSVGDSSVTSDVGADAALNPTPPVTTAQRQAKNAIYADLLGPGLFYSINYDRMLTEDLSARIGFSYLAFGASAGSGGESSSAEFSYYAIPLTVSYLGIGSQSNMLELGGGPILMHVQGSGIVEAEDHGADVSAGSTLLAMTGMVGYRHQPADGGLVFRIGASPVMAFGAGFLPWGYLSLGAAF
jgi:hypothetical protein